MGAPERHQVAGQPVARDGLASVNPEPAAPQAAEIGQAEQGAVGTCQDALRLVEKLPACFAELDSAPDPVEQLDAEPLLERVDGTADRGLGEMQRVRGTGHVLPFSDRDEDAELFERHGAPPPTANLGVEATFFVRACRAD